jgi:hypothetical protein
MTDATVSVRVDKRLHDQMRLHEEINWSAVIRKAIKQRLEDLEQVDVARAQRALESAGRVRESGIFAGGKTGAEIIREWRDKRR